MVDYKPRKKVRRRRCSRGIDGRRPAQRRTEGPRSEIGRRFAKPSRMPPSRLAVTHTVRKHAVVVRRLDSSPPRVRFQFFMAYRLFQERMRGLKSELYSKLYLS
jgi:hypothetical protein